MHTFYMAAMPRFMFDEDIATGGDPDSVEEPAVEEPVEEAVETGGESPWSNDLTEYFTDTEQRQAVDAFLKEKVQPYTTKLEQDSVENRRANNLWEQITSDPHVTFEKIAGELYGEEKAAAVVAAINGEEVDEPEVTEESEESVFDVDDMPPEVRDIIRENEQAKAKEAWDAEIARLKPEFEKEKIPFDENLFYPFVSAADGDMDDAAVAYKDWASQAKEQFGLKLKLPGAEEAAEEAAEDGPPPAINSETRTSTAPPVAERFDSFDAAFDAWEKEENAPPPVVGNT